MKAPDQRSDVKEALLSAISQLCQEYIRINEGILSIEGLLGIQFEKDHAVLFSVKESKKQCNAPSNSKKVTRTKNTGKEVGNINNTFSLGIIQRQNDSLLYSHEHNFPSIPFTRIKEEPRDEYESVRENAFKDHAKEPADTEIPFSNVGSSDRIEEENKISGRDGLHSTPKPLSLSLSEFLTRPSEIQNPHIDSNESISKGLDDFMTVGKNGPTENAFPDSLRIPQSPFNSEKRLQRHLDYLIMTDSGRYMCSFCEQTFQNIRNGRQHVEYKHLGIGHNCPFCGKLCRNKTEVTYHIKADHKDSFKVDRSDLEHSEHTFHEALQALNDSYKQNSPLKRKFSYEIDLNKVSCEEKGDIPPSSGINSGNSRDNSLIQESPSDAETKAKKCADYLILADTGRILCSLCDQTFLNVRNGRRHVAFKHFGIGHNCQFCGKLFRSKTEVTYHIQADHQENQTEFPRMESTDGSDENTNSNIEIKENERKKKKHCQEKLFAQDSSADNTVAREVIDSPIVNAARAVQHSPVDDDAIADEAVTRGAKYSPDIAATTRAEGDFPVVASATATVKDSLIIDTSATTDEDFPVVDEAARAVNDSSVIDEATFAVKDSLVNASTSFIHDSSVADAAEGEAQDPPILDAATRAEKYLDYLIMTDTGRYMCSACNQTFANMKNGKQHVDFKHLGIGQSCPVCGKLCRNKTEVVYHIEADHKEGSPGISCDQCGKVLKSRHTLKEHMLSVHNIKKRFCCHLCNRGFNNSKGYKEHLERSHIVCKKCGIYVVSMEGHTCSNGNPSTITEEDPYIPNKLSRKSIGKIAETIVAKIKKEDFTDQNDRHERTEMISDNISPFDRAAQTPSPTPSDCSGISQIPLNCDICAATFETEEDLEEHVFSHPQCLACGEFYQDESKHKSTCPKNDTGMEEELSDAEFIDVE